MSRKSRTAETRMPDNGLGELLAELKEVADKLPDKVDNRMILSAVIATRKEMKAAYDLVAAAVELNTAHRLDKTQHRLGWLDWKAAGIIIVAGLVVWVGLFALATANQDLLIALLGAAH